MCGVELTRLELVTPCLQRTCKPSRTVADLGLTLRHIRCYRPVSGCVVVRLGGQDRHGAVSDHLLRKVVGVPSPTPTPSPSPLPRVIIVRVPTPPHLPVPVRVVGMPGPDFWTVFLAVVSTVAAVLALIIAVVAYRKIAVERRTVFELEVLRDLLPLAARMSNTDRAT